MNQFSKARFEEIKIHRGKDYRYRDNGLKRQNDYEWLFAFTQKVIEDIGLDIEQAPTYFDEQEPETGCADLEDIADGYGLSLGQEVDIVIGYYTKSEPYRCSEIDEDRTGLRRVRDIDAKPPA